MALKKWSSCSPPAVYSVIICFLFVEGSRWKSVLQVLLICAALSVFNHQIKSISGSLEILSPEELRETSHDALQRTAETSAQQNWRSRRRQTGPIISLYSSSCSDHVMNAGTQSRWGGHDEHLSPHWSWDSKPWFIQWTWDSCLSLMLISFNVTLTTLFLFSDHTD